MNILFHKNFKKSFKKLPLSAQMQFNKRLGLFVKNPFHPTLHNHVLHGVWSDFRSINVTGDLRALYKPIDDNSAEFVIIDTHSNLYS